RSLASRGRQRSGHRPAVCVPHLAFEQSSYAERQLDLAVLRTIKPTHPVLPLEVFGERWAQWIRDAAEAAACPVDYVVAALLPPASALIGHARWAQAWPGWQEPPHLLCAAIGH